MPSPDAEDGSPERDSSSEPDESDVDMTADHKTDPRMGDASLDKKSKLSKSSSSLKDPTRPRRKKARRACLACQRAHLTCGESNIL